MTISTTQHQSAVYEVQRVVVPVSREVGQEAGGGAVGLSEESLDVSARVPGETPGHDQHRPIVVTQHLHHLLLLLAGLSQVGKDQEAGELQVKTLTGN